VQLLGRILLPYRTLQRAVCEKIEHLNRKQTPRPPMDADFHHRLQEELVPDVGLLSKLLNWDLTYWRHNE